MKKIHIYCFTGTIVTIISIYIVCLFNKPYNKTERPSNVPEQAILIGGCEGGNWFELVDIKEDTIRLRIYHDFNGELMFDADFISENCKDVCLTDANWSMYISHFDGVYVYFVNEFQSDGNYCKLIPVYPAHYCKEKASVVIY